ncbi:thermonuclease family protein [Pontibacter sp. 13R65]|uniref:thermonuclease family protein n=1 Tax=Pontibacter sp. 13R65 TaxID=3127458 RepID=UPI00301D99F7
MKLLHLKIYLLCLLLLLWGCKQDPGNTHETRQRQERTSVETAPAKEPVHPDPQLERSVPESKLPENTAGDRVVAVKDGDTMDLLRNGQVIKVRLYGIDSPEKNQDFGQRAKQYASDLAFGKYVKLIAHNTDRYGRTVGTIILPDGRNLNEEMVREGLAWHYKAYSKDLNLANLETDARRFKRGLWKDPNPVPPWDFRKGIRSNTATAAAPGTNQAKAPIPAGATKRNVYICNSSGSAVYHVSASCSVLKRCKAEVLTLTEAEAIREHSRRLDKTCGS